MTEGPILIPATRVARILSLLELTPPQDEVKEILLLPGGGLVTVFVHDVRGNRIPLKDTNGEQEWQTEMREIVYTDDPDPRFSSSAGSQDV